MKKHFYYLIFGLLLAITFSSLKANNILVSNTKLTGQNTTGSYVMVGFNHTRESCNLNPGNFNTRDAFLVMMKYYPKPDVYRQGDKFSTGGLATTSGLTKQAGLTNRTLALNTILLPYLLK